jgi:acyl-CoA thioesterase-1
MRIQLALILFVFLLISPHNSWADKTYRIVVFGDSITGGYQLQPQDAFPARLERKIRAAGYDNVSVVNLSDNNGTTASATTQTDKVLAEMADVIIVQLGYNDVKRGVVSSATYFNLNTILNALKPSGAYVILAGIPAPEGAAEYYKQEIEANFSKAASFNQVPLVHNILQGIANDPTMTLADGRHPNTAGVEAMVESIFPIVDTGMRWRYEVYMQQLQNSQRMQAPTLPIPSM